MTACQNISATANDQLVDKRNAPRTPLIKKTLTSINIDVTNWEVCAHDRPLWRSMIQTRARTAETNMIAEAQKKRAARKARLYPTTSTDISWPDIPMHRVWKGVAGPNWTD